MTTPSTLPSGWREVALGDVATFLSGGTPRKAEKSYWGGSVPWVSAKDMKVFRLDDSEDHVTVAGAENGTRMAPNNAVLILVRGMTLLNDIPVAIVQRQMTFNQDIKALLPQPSANSEYLAYTLLGNRDKLLGMVDLAGHGTGRLNTPDLKSLYLRLPPLDQQRAIAHILGTFDDKIELNRRMNETLEGMARALFTSWFVDFEPVRAKMDGRWHRGESLPGLPADLYDLFPDRLVPSQLGDIPEGWEVRALGDTYELTMGQSPPGDTYNESREGLPFFQGNADFAFRFPDQRRYCTKPSRVARPNDTLVSVRAPVGAINMAWEECCIGRGVAALRHKSDSTTFTYYSAQALQVAIQEFDNMGTVFGAITGKQFKELEVIEPNSEAVEAFASVVRSTDGQIRRHTAESRALAAQRDALLPRLVSGEVRV